MIPPIDEMVTPEMLAAMPEKDREQWQRAIDGQQERKRLMAEAANAGDWDKALMFCDSQERGPFLVRAMEALDGDDLRDIIAGWWSTTEAWSGVPELREGMFAGLRKAGLVIVPSDDPERLQKPPEGTFKVYRGNLGETPQAGCWSLDRDVAEMFARMASGIRGQLVLGMSGPGPASIWEADCDAADVIGFFDDRQEYEIVTDKVSNVTLIATAVSAEGAS